MAEAGGRYGTSSLHPGHNLTAKGRLVVVCVLWQHELNTFNLQQAKKRLKTFSPKGLILRENHYFSLAEEIAGKPLFFLEGGGGLLALRNLP